MPNKKGFNPLAEIKENPWLLALVFFGLIYSTTEILQEFLIGPRWLRWQIGAIGFSSTWALTLSAIFGFDIIKSIIASFIFQVVWEIFQGATGHFDPYDILMGAIGTFTVLMLARNYRGAEYPSVEIRLLLCLLVLSEHLF